jgi:hypothetical protein
MKYMLNAVFLLCGSALQASTVFLFNGTDRPLATVVMCNLIYDTHKNPYVISPEWPLSAPFVQKPFCAVNGFNWREELSDGLFRYYHANDLTDLKTLGTDLYIIMEGGAYTRVYFPNDILAWDTIGRLLSGKMGDLRNAIKNKSPLDEFFKRIGGILLRFSIIEKKAKEISADQF